MATSILAGPRVVSDCELTRSDFQDLAQQLGIDPVRARKVGFVAARRATGTERIATLWNDRETENTARPGDWIVTSLSRTQEPLRDKNGNLNTYVISADRFPGLYEPTGTTTPVGVVHKGKATVLAFRFPRGFDIVAPWGERQKSADGYLILNGDEVYGNNVETFGATYEILAG